MAAASEGTSGAGESRARSEVRGEASRSSYSRGTRGGGGGGPVRWPARERRRRDEAGGRACRRVPQGSGSLGCP